MNTLDRKSISIITPNYNHAQYLGQSCLSVLNQTSLPDEYIIIDDASTDNSIELINKIKDRNNFVKTIFLRKNSGVISVINKGLNLAASDYILFLAADDFLEPTLIESYRSALAAYPDVGFCSSLTYKFEVETQKIHLNKIPAKIPPGYLSPSDVQKLIIKNGPWFCGNTILLNRKYAIEAGGFDKNLLSYCDGFLYLVLALQHGIFFCDKPLSTYRRYKTSYSYETEGNIKSLEKIERFALHKMHSRSSIFSNKFIKRWRARWNYIKFYAVYIRGKKKINLLTKFFLSGLGFLYYRWFDLFNIRIIDLRAFCRDHKNRNT